MLRIASVLLTISLLSHAADLTNSGEPIPVPFACAEDDIQFVGLSCSESTPCPVYLELNAAASNGTRIVAAGDFHSGSGTIQSVLLATSDSGATWKEPAARIRGAALDLVQFSDPDHAWAAGEIQYPLPSDPFFLISTDGGQFWRQRTIGEEGSPGSILSFNFDSTRHGDLVIDAGATSQGGRYHAYESQTGGESWTARSRLREQPRLRPRIENTRLQTSKDGKSWVIERRSQNNDLWLPVASFAIDAAICSGRALAPDPPDPAEPAK